MKDKQIESGSAPRPDSNEELFRLALAAELEAVEFYRSLEEGFSRSAAVASFWRQMRRDEEIHVEELTRIREGLSPRVLSAPADSRILSKARQVSEFGLLGRAGRARNLDQAYELAHRLENSEIMTVFAFIREEFVPLCLQKNFTMSILEEHLNRIMNFPREFGDASARSAIPFRRGKG